MGLDMMLYRINKPEVIKDGEHISYQRKNELSDKIAFEKVESSDLCETVLNNSIRCFIEEKYLDLKGALRDLYLMIDPSISVETAGEYADTFRCTGSSYRNWETHQSMRTNDEGARKALLSTPGSDESKELILEDTRYWQVKAKIEDGGHVGITYICTSADKTDYEGKYLTQKVEEVYAFRMEKVAYQRKGLNGHGWDLLPENCCFCDDYDTVRQMVEFGGLSSEFTENWEDGKTVFVPWW